MSEYPYVPHPNPYPYPNPPVEPSSPDYRGFHGTLQGQASESGYGSYPDSACSSFYFSRFQEHMGIRGEPPYEPLGAVGTVTGRESTASHKDITNTVKPPKNSGTMAAIPTITLSQVSEESSGIASIDAVLRTAVTPAAKGPLTVPTFRIQRSEAELQPPRVPRKLQKRRSAPDLREEPPSPGSEHSRPSLLESIRRSADIGRPSVLGSLRRGKGPPRPVVDDLPYYIPPLADIQPPESRPKPRAPPSPKDLPYVLPPIEGVRPLPNPMASIPMLTVTHASPPSPSARPRIATEILSTGNGSFNDPPPINLISELRAQQAIRLTTTRERISLDVQRSTALQMEIASQRFAERAEREPTPRERRDSEKKTNRVKSALAKLHKEEVHKAELRAKVQAEEERKIAKAKEKEAEKAQREKEREQKKARAKLEKRYGTLERFSQNDFQMKVEGAARKMKKWVGLGPDPGWE